MINKVLFIWIAVSIFCVSCTSPESKLYNQGDLHESHPHFVEKVSYRDVTITDDFWKPKIEVNRVSSIRHSLKEAVESIGYFDIAAGISDAEHKGNIASDSDVFKIIQGAAYAMHHTPDPDLEAIIDSVIDRIVAAQQPDGYLFTYWIVHDLSKRWTDLPRKHELYCAGHMFEAAVAYYEVTGKRKFLDAAMRFADHIDSVFGPMKRRDVPGHEEIELALFKLYKITGEKRYLDLAAFFIDERGNPGRMIVEKITPPDRDSNAGTPNRWRPPSYMQDHLPVTRQYYAVGHAVRATYLYSAVTDLSMENETAKYIPALDSVWNDMVGKKLYITGGIGTRQFHDEGFGSGYLLPDDRAYCETCANIGLIFWNRRMSRLHEEAKYADLTELAMYNAALAGVSLSGDRFFYTNPLESKGKDVRQPWDDPPCCPTNVVRFLPEIGATIYGKREGEIYVNQFIGNEATIPMGGRKISLKLETNYPWDGKISLKVDPGTSATLTMHIRIPGWAQGELLPGNLYHYLAVEKLPGKVTLSVNGKELNDIKLEKGYAVIHRKWEPGDRVELYLPMDVRVVAGNPKLESAHGKVVLMRGPLVYCLEEVDNNDYYAITDKGNLIPNTFYAEYRKELLNGVAVIKGKATSDISNREINITAVPYFAWANRGQGKMRVWLKAEVAN